MTRKPAPAPADDGYRQRSLEGVEDGPLRARLRDMDEARVQRAWLVGAARKTAAYATGTVLAVAFIRDDVLDALRWIVSLFGGR